MTSTDGSNVIKSLKIQVDNDLIHQPNALMETESIDDEIEEGEASSDGEDEIEVNVIVGSKRAPDNIFLPDKQYGKKTGDSKHFPRAETVFYQPPAIRDRFRVTGQNQKSNSDLGKRPHRFKSVAVEIETMETNPDDFIPSEVILESRAKRFGIVPQSKSSISKKQIQDLYKSLEISEDDFHRGGWRPEAIHVRGIENLDSPEIFTYFKEFSPHCIEWLNKDSCNVVWTNKELPMEALIGLSCPIKLPSNDKLKNKKSPKTKEVLKMRKEIKKEGIDKKDANRTKSSEISSSSSDSSSDSSSSDSEDEEGSSSDSSSSSGSSSSSSSSSSDSSESSSDSSSDSEEEKKNSSTKEKVPPLSARVNSSEANSSNTNNNSDSVFPSSMDVVEPGETQEDAEMEASVTAEEVGVPIPSGRWRLGVPCPKTKAIFLRFAHCKDKKFPGVNKPLEINQSFIPKTAIKEEFAPEGESQRFFRKSIKPLARPYTDGAWKAPPLKPPRRFRERLEEPPLSTGQGYKDLDDPISTNRNPWGFLAQNWDRKETQDNLDYQELLRQHVTGQKRARDSSGTEEEDGDYRVESAVSRKWGRSSNSSRHKRPRLLPYHSRRSDEDDAYEDVDDDEDDVVAWNSRIRLPMMRMYADAEEKKQERRQKEARTINSRLGSGIRASSWREKRPRSLPSSGDLRSKLLQRKKKIVA